jgi:hypothetical protein
MQCVKSAKDESYGPVSTIFRDHTAFSEVLPVPDAPDDGWSYHPKPVEQFTEI